MKNFLLVALLTSTGLLSHLPSASQAIAPLRPLVVSLGVGTVVQRPLIGIDTAAYRSARINRSLDKIQLATRAARITKLEELMRHDSAATVATSAELQRVRQDYQRQGLELAAQQERTRKALALPVQKPFLLDPHTWVGAAIGVVGGFMLYRKLD